MTTERQAVELNCESTPRKARLRNGMLNILLVILSIIFSLAGTEVAYRIYLQFRHPERFITRANETKPPTIGVYNRSLWEFDAATGYRYVNGDIFLSHVDGGQVTSCQKISAANEYGNMGRIKGHWDTVDIKIAVFGDSFSAFVTQDNMTWPTFLQDFLEERLGRSVYVVNFGRDGAGILQMFDMARTKIPEWKPDLAIIAFTTDDLARARVWRTVNMIDGELRVLTVPEATPTANPLNSYETFILHPEATLEWCNSMSYKGHLDRIGKEIIDKYRRFRREDFFSIFTLSHSYLYALVTEGTPFASAKPKPGQRWSTRLMFDDYAHDARMVENVRWMKDNGIPYLLVHLPIYPEVQATQKFMLEKQEHHPLASLADVIYPVILVNKEFIMSRQQRRLLPSLTALTGQEIYRLLDYVEMPIEQSERMNVTPDNYHPSRWGMEFYARAVTELLLQNGHIKFQPKAAADR